MDYNKIEEYEAIKEKVGNLENYLKEFSITKYGKIVVECYWATFLGLVLYVYGLSTENNFSILSLIIGIVFLIYGFAARKHFGTTDKDKINIMIKMWENGEENWIKMKTYFIEKTLLHDYKPKSKHHIFYKFLLILAISNILNELFQYIFNKKAEVLLFPLILCFIVFIFGELVLMFKTSEKEKYARTLREIIKFENKK